MASGDDEETGRLDETSDETSIPDRKPQPRPTRPTEPQPPPTPPPPPSSSANWETLEATGNLQTGQIAFTRYLVDRMLGKGGMGSVWLVRHLELDRLRALKLIVAGLATDAQARIRFQREAKILARISEHPHAVAIHDARLTSSEVAYIDMEFIQGESLDKIFKKGQPMPLEWVDRILGQLCDVLQYAHDNKIIHRDLKPSNLMLVEGKPAGQEHLKVLDFGIGKIMGMPDQADDPRTMTGAFMGTPPYTSPEQGAGEAVPASDFYSVGVILFEFLTGHRPFTGSVVKMIAETMTTEPPSFREVNPDLKIPPEIEKVVRRCLAKAPEDRPPTAKAIAEEFHKAYLASLPKTGSNPDVTTTGKKPWGAILGGLAAAAVLLVGGIWYATRPKPEIIGGGGVVQNGGQEKPKGNATETKEPPPTVTAETVPVFIVFDPKTAEVTVGGKPRALDDGRLDLKPSDLPAEVVAKAEGHVTITRTVTVEEAQGTAAVWLALTLTPKPKPSPTELAIRSESILKTSCRSCHGVDYQKIPFDVLDRDALVASTAPTLLVPGDPSKSRIFAVASASHPAEKSRPALSSADLDVLKAWIEAGAIAPPVPSRPTRSDEADLAAVVKDLKAAKEADRPYLRYISLASLANRPLPDRTLRLARAAVSKALNSLSWTGAIFVPRTVDPEGMVLAVDVRNLGWETTRAWDRVLMPQYPYGLSHKTDASASLRELASEAESLTPALFSLVRADWLIATATRPPLYHALLGVPKTVPELETKLNVDAKGDFEKAELIRAASDKNPHALRPRIIDNHNPFALAFWRTYDLHADENGPGGIYKAPLGPSYDGHPSPEVAFRPDAEGILFGLPNGLNGYMLADGKGSRVDVAPDDLLRDPLKTAGTNSVVTGLSCIACHRVGVKRFQDQLSLRANANVIAQNKLMELRPKDNELEEILQGHEKKFLGAVDRATGSFLKVGEDQKSQINDFPEPVGPIARLYASDLDAKAAAAELGLADADDTAKKLAAIDPENKLGLAPLATGGTITRQKWIDAFASVAAGLKLGTVKQGFGKIPD